MRWILHGTWVVGAQGRTDDSFFVWAERTSEAPVSAAPGSRILRHPHAAAAIEVADFLSYYSPDANWNHAERLTRVAMLPSSDRAPIVPGWLRGDGEAVSEHLLQVRPWRIEGLGVPLCQMLDLLVSLPLENHRGSVFRRVGVDLRYWGIAAKLGVELLARQRFVPGVRAGDEGSLYGAWLPVLDAPDDRSRFTALAEGMPPACRAVVRENDAPSAKETHAEIILHRFLERLVDACVREWGALQRRKREGTLAGAARHGPRTVSESWWQSLWSEQSHIELPADQQDELGRFYRAWQSWTHRAQPQSGASFRICLRLEPPEFDARSGRVVSPRWVLRYFLQALDDPSLLVPAREVWLERGDTLSYLNRRFDSPQAKLLEGLGMAAALCPAVRRSLSTECPESTFLTDREAFAFLRETARLLEGMGFGVMVPPWWSSPDARLRVKVKLRAPSEMVGSGGLSMSTLVSYDWELALGDQVLDREEFERLAALKTPLVQVRGRWVLLQPEQVEAVIAFWVKHRDSGELGMAEAMSLALGAQTELEGLVLSDVDVDDRLAQLLAALTHHDRLSVLESPATFEGTLRPYQVLGFSWLAFLRRWRFGACLADDMGLGKTIQAIALLLATGAENEPAAPSLVVCPTSLVGNWGREIARFAPGLRVMIHHGSGRAEGSEFMEHTRRSDVVISTYGLVRRDLRDLAQVRWANVILDEAQNVKNPLTKQARAVRRLKADFRVALTGTPVENRLSELWSIMSFLNPGYLGSRESFRRAFSLPIERYQDAEAAEQLRKLVRPFILRRLKTDPNVIQDLPDKFEHRVFCNLTREQATLYEAVVRDSLERLQATGNGDGDMKRRGIVLAMITRLKQVCDHPALFLRDGSETVRRAGKLNRLCEMLEEILAVGERALVFTQFAQMGHLLQRHLQDAFGHEVLFLHGGTPQQQRERMLERFHGDLHGPAIFVLSLKAGGTGLNLMRANHVFHYDRWWNPAVENQATDRAYRIGQTRDVQVHKFICLGTLEERIDVLIESKRALAENVIGETGAWLTELDTQELRDLVSLRAEAVETG